MRFRVLGPLETRTGGGGPVRLGAAKQRTLLVVLLLHPNCPVGTGRLVTALWPGQAPRSTAGLVRTYVHGLRKALDLTGVPGGPRLATCSGGYRLELAPADLDLIQFEDLARRGRGALRQGEPGVAAGLLDGALALWRGRPAEDVAVDAESESIVLRLEEERMAAEEAWAEAQLGLGRHSDVIIRLRALVAERPLREQLWGMLMLALYRAGRQAEALAAFRDLRQRLRQELGIEPGPPLQRLLRQILTGASALDPPMPAAARVAVAPRQLPPAPSDFTGRQDELAQIGALAGEAPRAVTVCAIDGLPGVGKTALAVHAGHRVAASFPDGQLYANMHGSDPGGSSLAPGAALARFLRALGADSACGPAGLDGQAAWYRSVLAGRRMLVVLDDAGSADQVRPLLPGTPGCLVLITSRSRLRGLIARDGARRIALGSLAAAEAVTLLARIAGSARVDAELDAARQIAWQCGGLPLAVRAAAARLAAHPGWPVADLAGRLRDPAGRLDALEAEDLGVRSSLRSGYQMLLAAAGPAGDGALRAFAQLGLIRDDSFGLPAAALLTGLSEQDAERALGRLADARLVDNPATGRYWLHPLVHLFAREQAIAQRRPRPYAGGRQGTAAADDDQAARSPEITAVAHRTRP